MSNTRSHLCGQLGTLTPSQTRFADAIGESLAEMWLRKPRSIPEVPRSEGDLSANAPDHAPPGVQKSGPP